MAKLFTKEMTTQALRIFILFYASACCSAAQAFPSRLTVQLFSAHMPLKRIYVRAPFTIVERHQNVRNGEFSIEPTAQGMIVTDVGTGTKTNLHMSSVTLGNGANTMFLGYEAGNERHYFGTAKVLKTARGSMTVLNTVDCRHYVQSVVGSETQPQFLPEMLKAQAILVNTRIFSMRTNATIDDSTQTQAYLGSSYEREPVRAAVSAVWGKFLMYKNNPAQIYFHSTCAGKTSSAKAVFGKAASNQPYLTCVPCHFCKDSPFYAPTISSVPSGKFASTVGPLPTIEKLDCADRPQLLTIRKDGKQLDISGYQFWLSVGQKLGWDKLPGTRFKITPSPTSIRLESTGAGHGVGMCQWGAAGMARAGKTHQQILQHYFPGTTIESIAGG